MRFFRRNRPAEQKRRNPKEGDGNQNQADEQERVHERERRSDRRDRSGYRKRRRQYCRRKGDGDPPVSRVADGIAHDCHREQKEAGKRGQHEVVDGVVVKREQSRHEEATDGDGAGKQYYCACSPREKDAACNAGKRRANICEGQECQHGVRTASDNDS
ncbi:hypothetical protein ACFFQF_07000 [Haladaptatus pallidirubidus]|uniref:Uncharacterized protein n=1 Tax=Haladaptatus pallidirubidus TaxID=1008152 RepID=A0AAV3UMI7_9EURY|nr:hypothetical protein [Haladaptatus pallidirubidus]